MYDDVTYVYDDVTYVYDDVTYVYADISVFIRMHLRWRFCRGAWPHIPLRLNVHRGACGVHVSVRRQGVRLGASRGGGGGGGFMRD